MPAPYPHWSQRYRFRCDVCIHYNQYVCFKMLAWLSFDYEHIASDLHAPWFLHVKWGSPFVKV